MTAILTPNNIGKSLETSSEPGKFNINVDNSTVKINSATGKVFVPGASQGADGLFTAADKIKLDSIESNATKNQSDSVLKNRANHTGVQDISTIAGLQGELDNKSNVGHGHAISAVAGLQTELDGKAAASHTHAISDVTNLQTELDGKIGKGPNDNIVRGVENGELVTLPATGIAGSDANNYFAYNGALNRFEVYVGGVLVGWADSTGFHNASGDPIDPPEEFAMLIGMNLPWLATWSGALVFANLMYGMDTSGYQPLSSFSNLGYTTESPDDGIVFSLMYPSGLPEGTYTVRNPNGLAHAIGGGGLSASAETNTNSSYTFTIPGTGDVNGVWIMFKGSHTFADFAGFEIIIPGHTASYDGGNIWNQSFINFHKGLKTKVLRTMDMVNASGNMETNWNERSLPCTGRGTFFNSWFNKVMPWEYICDLSNRIGAEPWVCVPHRATQDYVDNMAQIFADNLTEGKKVWIETGNEIWNSGGGWARGTNWVQYLEHTKISADCDADTDKFTKAAHGLTDGNLLHLFSTIEDILTQELQGGAYDHTWLFKGMGLYVRNADADTFELWTGNGSAGDWGVQVDVPPKFSKCIYLVAAEAGKSPDLNGNYGVLSKRNWDAFDAKIGRSSAIHVLARQYGNTNTISAALAATGVKDATDYVAVAPYFGGIWWGAKLAYGNAKITPSLFCNKGSVDFHFGVYASGSTPSHFDVAAGAGTGFVKHAVVSLGPYDGMDSSAWNVKPDITGLTNETAYTVFVLFYVNGVPFMQSGSVTPHATTPDPDPGATIILDSFENQMLRNNIVSWANNNGDYWDSVVLAAAGKPFVNYEGGLHFHESAPPEVLAWRVAYQESPEFGQAIVYDQRANAAAGKALFCYYADVLGTTFSIANNFDDTGDERYKALKSLGGGIAATIPIDVAAIVIDSIDTAPLAYPYIVHDFDMDGVTATLLAAPDLYWEISDNKLRLLEGNGYDFGVPQSADLYFEIAASNNHAFAGRAVGIGYAWYEVDALYAFDSIGYTDTTKLTPVKGNVYSIADPTKISIADGIISSSETAGVPADIWSGGSAPYTRPVLLAFVDGGFTGDARLQLGGSEYITFSPYFGGWKGSSNETGDKYLASPAFVSKCVRWLYVENANSVIAGVDQNTGGSSADLLAGSIALSPYFILSGGLPGMFALGSLQVVRRAGMTLSAAKAIIAKMQAHHGIA